MLRRIVGWRRVEGEEWRATMIRMNGRLARALHLYPCQPWAVRHAKNQSRYIHHLIYACPLLWARILWAYPVYDPEINIQPLRKIGHPRLRWDNHIKAFC